MSEMSTLIRPKVSKKYQPDFYKISGVCDGCDIIKLKDLQESLIPHKHSNRWIPYLQNVSSETLRYIIDKLDLGMDDNILMLSSHDPIISENLKEKIINNDIKAVVDLELANRTRYVNKHFEFINSLLPHGGYYLGCVETHAQRNNRIYKRFNKYLAKTIILFEFLFHRVLPKVNFIQKIYFAITKGKYRFLTKSETLGRVVSCGFYIPNDSVEEIDNLMWFAVTKQREPYYDMSPSYGPIIKLRRVGKDGKIFNVYKFRTMHPYSEYLQDYVIRVNGYSEIGKPANDFRVTDWGKYFRKYWLDEIPQLYNVLRGEMKLVSIRPLSLRFLQEYPEDIKNQRMRFKPGCIPPYVALLKQDVEEYIEAERIYMNEVEKHPYLTDMKYFARAVYNILTNKIRSS